MKASSYYGIALLTILLLAIATGCTGGSTKENRDEPKAMYSCVLYADNNGELKNSNGERLCAVKAYSRSEPISLNFSTEIEWNGIKLEKIYLKGGKVYTEFPYSSKIDEYTPVATYNMSSVGADMSFEFFSSITDEQAKEMLQAQDAKRQAEEEERERERLEVERNTWTGASSLDELKSKLDGSTWHCVTHGMIYKFVFSNGTVTRYLAMARDGKWSDKVIYFSSYNIEQKRDSGGNNYIQVSFGDNSDLDHASQQIAFIDKCKTVAWLIGGNLVDMLSFGDYKWSDSL